MVLDPKKTLPDNDITDRLAAELPKWRLEDGWIRRTYKTNSWKGTLMVINTVGHLAEAAWHHPDLTASYAWVEVRLMSHDAKGITERDFQLAKKIEDVVGWQPGTEQDGVGGRSCFGRAAWRTGQARRHIGNVLAPEKPRRVGTDIAGGAHVTARHVHGQVIAAEAAKAADHVANRARPIQGGISVQHGDQSYLM